MIWPISRRESDHSPAQEAPAAQPTGQDLAMHRLEQRLKRMETRLCVLMKHQGLDPNQGVTHEHHPAQAGTPPVR